MVYNARVNIGIDIIAVDKFRTLTVDDYKHWEHVFAHAEWTYAFADELSVLHLAGIYAAKEALMKATGLVGPKNFRNFTITHTNDGVPKVVEYDASISISHDAGVAVAVALVQ